VLRTTSRGKHALGAVSGANRLVALRPLASDEGTETMTEGYSRSFRPDVQALRALAVGLVVWYHAHLPGLHGGFLGVDVFFVISGFVITGVLLQEQQKRGSISIADFYGRRIRRILPAATVVLVLTLFAVYHWLGFIAGAQNATDAKWVAAFMGNLHFASTGTQYLSATLPPSVFQQYWSLAVEEQFYLVWPLLFFVLVAAFPKISPRTKLLTALVAIIVASYAWSVVETGQNEVWAFFSPLTRAWELALGASIAVLVPVLRDRSKRLGLALGILGVAGIVASALLFKASTPWPGSAALVPVAATALVIAGGTLRQSSEFGRITTFSPIQWLGNISYSLYLVHWPVLTIALEYSIKGSLPVGSELELVSLSIVISAILYYALENPLRKWKLLKQSRVLTYCMGAILIAISYGAIFWHIHNVAK
jgi:peptidoglycan/LPS O-acetylase OafA/YrhL